MIPINRIYKIYANSFNKTEIFKIYLRILINVLTRQIVSVSV